jgi:hypothetical protein
MNENNRLCLSKHNEAELKKEEAIKALAYLIKKYAGELLKENDDIKSSR